MTVKQAFYLTRPYSLPASIAPIIVAIVFFAMCNGFTSSRQIGIATSALLVGLFGQIVSNLANDLVDFKKGTDVASRKGFKRMLTTGEVSAKDVLGLMVFFTVLTALSGLVVVILSSYLLIFLGIFVLIGAFAYSYPPFSLSYRGFGEIQVFLFYGLIAVVGTYWALSHEWQYEVFALGAAMGLANTNILIVNNYRDVESDREHLKKTLAVRFGAPLMPLLYQTNILLIIFCMIPFCTSWKSAVSSLLYLLFALPICKELRNKEGEELNKVLGKTALLVLVLAVCITQTLYLHYLSPIK